MKKHIILFIAIFFASVLHAQTINIRGTVTDTSNETLPGVSITIKGTQTGTVSDANGNYSIRAQRGNVLEFTFVGMVKQSVTVGKQNVINIQMAADAINLDEVVAIGYGIAKKSDLTGAVASIKSENLTNSKVGTVTTALQGLAAGVQVTTGSVKPGGDASVVIRGVGSLRAGSEPLYIVDGIPVQGGLQDLSSGDIESIEILKDASSASIYGSRGSNGVVLVTTKKGTSGKAKISLNASFGTQRMLNKQDLMNAQQYYELVSIAQPNYKWTSEELRLLSRGESTDWQDAVTQNGQYQNYNFSISGGKNDIQHFLGVDWYDQKGTIKNSSFNKLTVRYNMDAKLNKWLRYGVRFNVIESKLMNINEEADSGYGTMFSAISSQPTAPIYTEDGEYFDGFLNTRANPVAIVDLLDKATLKSRFVGSAYIEIEPIKNLKLRSDNGGELVFYKVNTYEDGRMGQHYTAGGHANVMSNKKRYWQTENTATYSFDINKEHQLSAMAGFSASRTDYEEVTADSKKLSSILKYYNLQGAEEHGPNSSYAVPSSLVSFYGRFNYNFSNRYLATLTMRGDGSSRFAPGNRWGLFPSFSAGYDISRTDYFKALNLPVSQLKVRVSYGRLGNQNGAGLYDYLGIQSLTSDSPNAWLLPGVQATPQKGTLATTPKMISSYITWEKVDNANLGIDLMLLDNRLSVTADIYQRTTRDMIGPAEAIPNLGGISTADRAKVNNATLRNRGWELSVNWQDQLKCGFSYGIGFNVFNYKAVVTKYNNPEGLIYNNHTGLATNKGYYEGMDIGEIWGYEANDLFLSNREVDAYLRQVDLSFFKSGDKWQRGDLKYIDSDGDGKVDPGKGTLADHGDLKIIGNATPKYSFGINLNVGYKGFEISTLLQGVAKRDFPMAASTYLFGGKEWFKEHLDYFSPENPNGYLPRLTTDAQTTNANTGYNTTRYMLNAAYMRMKNLTVSYTFKPQLLKNIGLSNLKVYFTCDNLFTISKLPNQFDPETLNQVNAWAGGSNAAALGLTSAQNQNGNGKVYPMNRNFVFGLDFTF